MEMGAKDALDTATIPFWQTGFYNYNGSVTSWNQGEGLISHSDVTSWSELCESFGATLTARTFTESHTERSTKNAFPRAVNEYDAGKPIAVRFFQGTLC
jgi:hypothetical protein